VQSVTSEVQVSKLAHALPGNGHSRRGANPLRIFLTFDIEVWCGAWDHLDERFPAAYRRYVYGADERGGYALPMTLRILAEHGLKAVFFVEPLFSARFGLDKLGVIVDLIQEGGQEVQLHLHPEWCDEAQILSSGKRGPKRPALWQFDVAEQEELIRIGTEMLRAAGARSMRAFRAGNFAANADTLRALSRVGYAIDSSLNATVLTSFPGDDAPPSRVVRSSFMGVESFPISVFIDGFGRPRHAQLGACGFVELAQAIGGAASAGWRDFVLLSHGFELLKHDSVDPDQIVIRRYQELCALLRQWQDDGLVRTAGFDEVDLDEGRATTEPPLPRVSRGASLTRYLEQARRRLW